MVVWIVASVAMMVVMIPIMVVISPISVIPIWASVPSSPIPRVSPIPRCIVPRIPPIIPIPIITVSPRRTVIPRIVVVPIVACRSPAHPRHIDAEENVRCVVDGHCHRAFRRAGYCGSLVFRDVYCGSLAVVYEDFRTFGFLYEGVYFFFSLKIFLLRAPCVRVINSVLICWLNICISC